MQNLSVFFKNSQPDNLVGIKMKLNGVNTSATFKEEEHEIMINTITGISYSSLIYNNFTGKDIGSTYTLLFTIPIVFSETVFNQIELTGVYRYVPAAPSRFVSMGDVNMSDRVDINDINTMYMHISFPDANFMSYSQLGDVVKNNRIDVNDINYMYNHISFSDVFKMPTQGSALYIKSSGSNALVDSGDSIQIDVNLQELLKQSDNIVGFELHFKGSNIDVINILQSNGLLKHKSPISWSSTDSSIRILWEEYENPIPIQAIVSALSLNLPFDYSPTNLITIRLNTVSSLEFDDATKLIFKTATGTKDFFLFKQPTVSIRLGSVIYDAETLSKLAGYMLRTMPLNHSKEDNMFISYVLDFEPRNTDIIIGVDTTLFENKDKMKFFVIAYHTLSSYKSEEKHTLLNFWDSVNNNLEVKNTIQYFYQINQEIYELVPANREEKLFSYTANGYGIMDETPIHFRLGNKAQTQKPTFEIDFSKL